MRYLSLFFVLLLTVLSANAKIQVVAAENMYADIAQTLGGDTVSTTSIMSNPNQDPHLFSADPKTVKLLDSLTSQDIIIVNGADYDPWAINLLRNTQGQVINVAKLNSVEAGSNPHLWYNLTYVGNFAKALTTLLIKNNPSQKNLYQKNLNLFLKQINTIQEKINTQKTTYANLSVTATEPVAGYLLNALGFKILDKGFQLSVMNDTEPSVKDRAQMLTDLNKHHVALLIYNEQVKDPTTDMVKQTAKDAGVPIVGVSELMPPNTDYLTWYQKNIDAIHEAIKL